HSLLVPQDARTKPLGDVKIGAGIAVFGLEFDLIWCENGILIDACFGEPPWPFDGLSLTFSILSGYSDCSFGDFRRCRVLFFLLMFVLPTSPW
ncbi:unnamed protein product, partial [Musa textilis]